MKPDEGPSPDALARVFGDGLPVAQRFVDHLRTTGVDHGLIGPREVPRIWERHVVNCALIDELLPANGDIADLGSGAGLPGIVTAILRPRQQHYLIETMERRTVWLQMVIDDLKLGNVTVLRSRAEDLRGKLSVPVVTARAVAPLDRLTKWAMPLLARPGELIAIKGRSAAGEVERTRPAVLRTGATSIDVVEVGSTSAWEPTTVVRVRRA